jgi:hypothetical protein
MKGTDAMKTTLALFVLVLPLFAAPCIAGDAAATKGEEISSRLILSLQQELVSAMGKGGAVNAIEVCSKKAFMIAEGIAKETGAIRVSRISEKYRNPLSRPDDFDRNVLAEFMRRKGESGSYPPFLLKERENSHIYYRPVITGELCLKCHGEKEKMAPEARIMIDLIYPDDRATGYGKGDLRGLIRVEMRKERN